MDSRIIRNFAIVAHVDHGKSTLADRLIEATGTISKKNMQDQLLDSNPIERERGITIKLAPIRMEYSLPDYLSRTLHSDFCILNLIDTPGHVDFSYEVSRSLTACEGIILVVDATQGIQAQTLAYMQLIKEKNLPAIPVINKIDLPNAQIDETKDQMSKTFGFKKNDFIEISAKRGLNIDILLEAIVKRIPPPQVKNTHDLQALIFSSQYDQHRGVVIFVRVINGKLRKVHYNQDESLMLMSSKTSFRPLEIGYFTPIQKPSGILDIGEVGYIATGLKDISLARVGDTVTYSPVVLGNSLTAKKPLPGYKKAKPMVFLGFFPVNNDDFLELRDAVEKLNLQDSAFTYKPVSSKALGKGFHCGFLGLLHAEIVQERLYREFGISLIPTTPTVEYHMKLTNGEEMVVQRADNYPDPTRIKEVKEPIMKTTIYSPKEYIGSIMDLAQSSRGEFIDMTYTGNQVMFIYTIPLSEMVIDFYDQLKSITSGYASMDYEFFSYELVNLVKLEIFIHGKAVDALSMLVVKDKALKVAKDIVDKLKYVIPRHQFQIPIQAAIGGNIIARSNVKPFRKDVTKKLYGGDRTRKDKLLKKQKKGKKKMKMVGNVKIPQEAFMAVLKR